MTFGEVTGLSFASGGTYQSAHGASGGPDDVTVRLLCTSTDGEFVTGIHVVLPGIQVDGSSEYGIMYRWDSTNMYFTIANGGVFLLTSLGQQYNINESNWDIQYHWRKYS